MKDEGGLPTWCAGGDEVALGAILVTTIEDGGVISFPLLGLMKRLEVYYNCNDVVLLFPKDSLPNQPQSSATLGRQSDVLASLGGKIEYTLGDLRLTSSFTTFHP